MDHQNKRCVGLIAEYNPFHNGHLYHIEKSKELAHADYCVVVMSGDFVQRGAPAVYDKHTRARMALEAGADLVLELPAAFATSSAEDFATYGIRMLDQLGIIDAVCFGSECGDLELLQSAAHILADEPEEYSVLLRDLLKQGLSFPEARSKALLTYMEALGTSTLPAALSSPNNILGIEYCKALIRLDSSIEPLTITRIGHGYHDTFLSEHLASASAIRTLLQGGTGFDAIADQVPACVLDQIAQGYPLFPEDLSFLLNQRLLSLSSQKEPLNQFLDVSDDLALRIQKTVLEYDTFEQRIQYLKTRQYTYTRISRALLHIALGITDADLESYKSQVYLPYVRILGFCKDSAAILKEIKNNCPSPLITKIADAAELLSPVGQHMLEQELYCSHLYQLLKYEKYHINSKNEYTQELILI